MSLHPLPLSQTLNSSEIAMDVITRIKDLNIIYGQTQDHPYQVLVANTKNIKN